MRHKTQQHPKISPRSHRFARLFHSETRRTAAFALFLLATGLSNSPAVEAQGRGANASGVVSSSTHATFGKVPVGSSNSQTIRLSNTQNTSATVSAATVTGSGYSITGLPLPVTIAARKNVTFNIVFAPAAAGLTTGSVSITTTSSNFQISLAGTGTASSQSMSVSATSVSFGNVTLGNTASEGVTITSTGNSAVTISSVSFTGAGISATGIGNGTVLNAGQSATLNVEFAPGVSGTSTGTVTVTSTATNSPQSISVSGVGVSPVYSVALGWDASSSTDVTGYNVYRSNISGGPYTKIASFDPSLTYTDSGVQSGLAYYYVVTSLDSTGMESGYSGQISASIP